MKTRIFFLSALWPLLYTSYAQPGDLCNTAYPITLDDPTSSPCSFKQISSLDFNDYVSNTGVPNPGCSYGAINYDFWIKITLPSNSDGLKITIDSTISSDNDYQNFVVATYTGSDCSSLTYRSCKTTSRKTVYNNFFDGYLPGETVYARIYRKNSSSGTWDLPFFIRLTAINTSNSEDACSKARMLSPGTYCNYTSTDKNESDNNAPDKLTGTDEICQPGNLAFGSFDNNQWYYFEVNAATPQPVQIAINNVQCSAGDQILQAAIWKTTAYNCSNWAGGYDLNNPSNANDGDLIACAVGSGTVDITKNLPVGKYWYTIDGSAGAFCKYEIITTVNPPLPLRFLNVSMKENRIHWNCFDDREVKWYVIQSSRNGIDFENQDTIRSRMSEGVVWYEREIITTAPYIRIAAKHFSSEIIYSPVLQNKNFSQKTIQYQISENGKITVFGDCDFEYSLFESTGKIILSGKSKNKSTEISIENYQNLLLLYLISENEIMSYKLINY